MTCVETEESEIECIFFSNCMPDAMNLTATN